LLFTDPVIGQIDCDYQPEGKVIKLIEKATDKKNMTAMNVGIYTRTHLKKTKAV